MQGNGLKSELEILSKSKDELRVSYDDQIEELKKQNVSISEELAEVLQAFEASKSCNAELEKLIAELLNSGLKADEKLTKDLVSCGNCKEKEDELLRLKQSLDIGKPTVEHSHECKII